MDDEWLDEAVPWAVPGACALRSQCRMMDDPLRVGTR